MSNNNRFNRRDILKTLLGVSPWILNPTLFSQLAGCTPSTNEKESKQSGSRAYLRNGQPRKFLFVFGAMGGASINDSFLSVRQSECGQPDSLNVYPDDQVVSIDGTNLRALDFDLNDIGPLPFPVKSRQSTFLKKHFQDIMVTTLEHSSVSHPIGQKRILTGYDAWQGRTLQELVALHYGEDLPIPNANMSSLGFAERGSDPSLPKWAFAEPIADPAFFPFGLDGYRGIDGVPSKDLIQLARNARHSMEQQSNFYKTFQTNSRLQRWLEIRQKKQPVLEQMDLINRLNPFEDTKDLPFSDYGLEPHPSGDLIRDFFPDLGQDPLQTQAALAYLMVTQAISSTVTFGYGMNVSINANNVDNPLLTNTPTGFDYSHNAHRGTQGLLWNRSFDILDRLINLLKLTEYGNGESFWDHSMILIATEFGRSKSKPKDTYEFTSGHHQSNGVVMISPMTNGGQILGGVDPNTLLTYGFNPQSGAPEPGRVMSEKEIFSGILQAMDIPTKEAGLPDMKAMRRA
jgi:hypothetical protein